jgi:hypothetical protein
MYLKSEFESFPSCSMLIMDAFADVNLLGWFYQRHLGILSHLPSAAPSFASGFRAFLRHMLDTHVCFGPRRPCSGIFLLWHTIRRHAVLVNALDMLRSRLNMPRRPEAKTQLVLAARAVRQMERGCCRDLKLSGNQGKLLECSTCLSGDHALLGKQRLLVRILLRFAKRHLHINARCTSIPEEWRSPVTLPI